MEFNQKLQELRKSRDLTQEELARALFVSRTAISKWESGRGYPGIDSLKAISEYFSVSIDELLSSNEILVAAKEDNRQKVNHFRDLIFGLLDISVIMLLFLPLFGQESEGLIHEVSLISLEPVAIYTKVIYYIAVASTALMGVLVLALQSCQSVFWQKSKRFISLALTALGTLLFILGMQPYAATFLFIFLAIKVLILIKKP